MITGSLLLILLALLIVTTVIFAIVAPIAIHLPQFGKTPSGKRLERIQRSPNFYDDQFHNRTEAELKITAKMLFKTINKMLFSKKNALVPPKPLEMQHVSLKELPVDKDCMVWFGHSSYLLSLHGTTILVDPTFCSGAPFSFVNKAFPGTSVYQPEEMPDVIDYLIITHDHYDHLDYKSFLRLKSRVRQIICPLGVGAHLEHWGADIATITEMDWDEVCDLKDGWRIHCLPSQHFSGRALKRNNTLWASFLLETPHGRIFAGCDGGYGPHFKEIGKKYAPIDLAILENGQYNELWRHIHTMPDQLGQEALDLGAREIITIHHSKYALAQHKWDEPLHNEAQARDECHLNLLIPRLGDVTEIMN
jgi:L-ascorbate metabolism protein UlaG (beta-lactamase superfamily)